MSKYIALQDNNEVRLWQVNPYQKFIEGSDVISRTWQDYEQSKRSFLTDDHRVVVGQQYPAEEYETVWQYQKKVEGWTDINAILMSTTEHVLHYKKAGCPTRQILRRKAEVEKAVEIIDPIKLLKEYQERLNEVYKHTGKLTNIDVDYCLLMTLHDNNIHFTVN